MHFACSYHNHDAAKANPIKHDYDSYGTFPLSYFLQCSDKNRILFF